MALSRLRTLGGLILRTRIDPSVVSTDKDVMAFSERQHTQQPLPEQLKEQQRHYLQAVLASTFDLGDITKKIGFVRKDNDADEFEDESMKTCLLYTSDAADERSREDLGGRRSIKKKNTRHQSEGR
mgnify:CR=1 FL=1